MILLSLDTSSARGSAALVGNGALLSRAGLSETGDHVRRLVPAVSALLRERGLGWPDLGLILAGSGPGSFVGTRIGMVAARALSTAANTPVAELTSMLGYDFSAGPEGRRHYLCKDKDGSYHRILRRAGDRALPLPEAVDVLTEEALAGQVNEGDLLTGPLTAKNWDALRARIRVPFRIEPGFPDAGWLALNFLQLHPTPDSPGGTP